MIAHAGAGLRGALPAFALASFILFVFTLYLNGKVLKTLLCGAGRSAWSALVLVFVSALMLRLFIPWHHHVVYVDEAWYMEAAKNILRSMSAGDYPKEIGWPFILSMVFGVFGVAGSTAIYATVVIGALTSVSVFLLAYVFTGKKEPALAASLLFSLFPAHIRYSACAESNAASLFFVTLTLTFCGLYYREKTNAMIWLAAAALGFTAQIRPENYAFPALFLAGCAVYSGGNMKAKMLSLKFLAPLVVAALLSLPNLLQVLDFKLSVNWIESDTFGKMTGSNWSFSNFVNNSAVYGVNLFNGRFQPVFVAAAAAVGAVRAAAKRRRDFLFLALWFCLMWTACFTSWFQTLAGRERFYTSFYPITAIFAAWGIEAAARGIAAAAGKSRLEPAAFALLTALAVAAFIPYAGGIKPSNPAMHMDNARRLETKIPETAERDLPADCIIVAVRPVILRATTDLKVVDARDFLRDGDFRDGLFEAGGCLLFFQDMTCMPQSPARRDCAETMNAFRLTPYRSYREKDVEFGFLRMSGETGAPGGKKAGAYGTSP
ncbi:MAG: hypothetical protein AB1742_00775 [bacterium]